MNLIKKRIKEEYEDYLRLGYCQKAKELNEKMGIDNFFDIHNPHYFTGKLDRKVVAVNLNPKRDYSDRTNQPSFNSFEEFWDHYENFGKNIYELPENKKTSKFDNKQVRFYKGAGLLNLKEKEENLADKFNNLKLVMENKLQWELIPYGSPDFTFGKIGIENIKPFLIDAVKIATLYQRDYIFFNGAVFRGLLTFDNIKCVSKHKFKLKKNDGTYAKREDHEIINILINNNIKAAILSHYAYFNTPLPDYGRMVVNLYHKS